MRLWQSGQMQRTVNPPVITYGGSNPPGRTRNDVSRFGDREHGICSNIAGVV